MIQLRLMIQSTIRNATATATLLRDTHKRSTEIKHVGYRVAD